MCVMLIFVLWIEKETLQRIKDEIAFCVCNDRFQWRQFVKFTVWMRSDENSKTCERLAFVSSNKATNAKHLISRLKLKYSALSIKAAECISHDV